MTEKEINILIDKFLSGNIADNDFQLLQGELKTPKNKKVLEELIEVNAFIHPEKKVNLDVLKVYDKISKDLGFSNTKRNLGYRISKYAAVFIGLLGVAYYFQVLYTTDSDLLIENYENSITLQLENGTIEVISESGEKKIINKNGKIVGTQSGDKLFYKVDEELEVLVYNELNIPNGKTFQLQLSDGSTIHLNAGSSLKYPINFIKGEERRVFLKGEAYFEVTKDKEHPFIVTSNNKLDIRVLGTQFNVNTYNGENAINTVLVEGSVALYKEGDTYDANTGMLLEPGHLAKWNSKNNVLTIEKVDTRDYTAWINGELLFKKRNFLEISQILERHFDIDIENNYDFLNSQRFLASFKSESIEEILEYFKRTTNFKYELKDNKIIINKP
jgi:transmembrane sensor